MMQIRRVRCYHPSQERSRVYPDGTRQQGTHQMMQFEECCSVAALQCGIDGFRDSFRSGQGLHLPSTAPTARRAEVVSCTRDILRRHPHPHPAGRSATEELGLTLEKGVSMALNIGLTVGDLLLTASRNRHGGETKTLAYRLQRHRRCVGILGANKKTRPLAKTVLHHSRGRFLNPLPDTASMSVFFFLRDVAGSSATVLLIVTQSHLLS